MTIRSRSESQLQGAVSAAPSGEPFVVICHHCGGWFCGCGGPYRVCPNCWHQPRALLEQIGSDVFPYFADDGYAAHPDDGRMEPEP
jgi:hypothetical protein